MREVPILGERSVIAMLRPLPNGDAAAAVGKLGPAC